MQYCMIKAVVFITPTVRELRINMGLTQERLAGILGVRQDSVSRLDKATLDQVDGGILVTIASIMGQTIDNLLGYKRYIPPAIELSDACREMADEKLPFYNKELVRYVLDNIDVFLLNKGSDPFDDDLSYYLFCLDNYSRLPLVAIMGGECTGKSSMFRHLVGLNIEPTGLEGSTTVPVYAMRPPKGIHIADGVPLVRVYRRVDESELSDTDFARAIRDNDLGGYDSFILKSGSLELIEQYGTAGGSCYSEDISAIVVYAQRDILNYCVLVDTPPLREDSVLVQWNDYGLSLGAGILVFCSSATEFLQQSHAINALRHGINRLASVDLNGVKPLLNLFIVETQHHLMDTEDDYSLKERVSAAHLRLERSFPETPEGLHERFFVYAYDKPEFCDAFIEGLCSTTMGLTASVGAELETYMGICLDLCRERLKSIKNRAIGKIERSRVPEDTALTEQARDGFKTWRMESEHAFKGIYDDVISEAYIEDLIRRRGLKNKQESYVILTSYLNAVLDERRKKVLIEIIPTAVLEIVGSVPSGDFSSDVSRKIETGVRAVSLFDSLFNIQMGLVFGPLGPIIVRGGVQWMRHMARRVWELYEKHRVCDEHIELIGAFWNQVADEYLRKVGNLYRPIAAQDSAIDERRKDAEERLKDIGNRMGM